MPAKTVDVQPGEYVAYIREIDYTASDVQPKETYWVHPTRVYKGVRGRQSIEFERNGEMRQLHNYPGAGSFDLYKRVP